MSLILVQCHSPAATIMPRLEGALVVAQSALGDAQPLRGDARLQAQPGLVENLLGLAQGAHGLLAP